MPNTQSGKQCYRLCLNLWMFKVNPPLETTVNNFNFTLIDSNFVDIIHKKWMNFSFFVEDLINSSI